MNEQYLINETRKIHGMLLAKRKQKRNMLRDKLTEIYSTDKIYEAIIYQQLTEANEGIKEIRGMIDQYDRLIGEVKN